MSTASQADTPPATDLRRVASERELEGDGPFARSVAEHEIVLLRTPRGQLRAFEGRCPHQGALLGEGELVDDQLVCRNHRWRFDAESGQRDGGSQCLRACPVEVRDGSVLVDVSALADTGVRAAGTRRVRDLPGPSTIPLLGNALDFDVERMHLAMEGWAEQFGATYQFSIGTRRIMAVTDPAMHQEALRDRPERFRRWSNFEDVFEELSAHGVFSAEGAAWRPQRRLSMEALSHRHLRGFYGTLQAVAARLVRRLAAEARGGEEVDVNDLLKRFTVDVTTQLAFGHDVNTLEERDGQSALLQHLEQIFPGIARRIVAPVPYWRWFKLPVDRDLDRALVEVRGFLTGLVEETRARLEEYPDRKVRPTNFLEAMLVARDEHDQPFSVETILGNAMQILLAGEDTTAHTLAWAVHELCERPDVVAALRAEADEVLGDATVPPDIDAAGRLAYANGVANETMRLRPVAPFVGLEATHDTTLGDVALPAGQRFVLLTRPPGLTAQHFEAPAELRPERWLDRDRRGDAQDGRGAHDPSVMLPFGSGPRICPGRSLALLEMRLVLAAIYKEFDLVRVGRPSEVSEVFAFTMHARGLYVRVKPRRRAG